MSWGLKWYSLGEFTLSRNAGVSVNFASLSVPPPPNGILRAIAVKRDSGTMDGTLLADLVTTGVEAGAGSAFTGISSRELEGFGSALSLRELSAGYAGVVGSAGHRVQLTRLSDGTDDDWTVTAAILVEGEVQSAVPEVADLHIQRPDGFYWDSNTSAYVSKAEATPISADFDSDTGEYDAVIPTAAKVGQPHLSLRWEDPGDGSVLARAEMSLIDDDLDGQTSTLQGDISAIESKVEAIPTTEPATEAQVNAARNVVTGAITSQTSTLQGDIGAVESKVDGVTNTLGAMTHPATGIEAVLQEAIDAIDIDDEALLQAIGELPTLGQILGADISGHTAAHELAGAIRRILGLRQHNMRLDNTAFRPGSTSPTAGSVTLHPTKADTLAGANAWAEYSLAAAHNEDGALTAYTSVDDEE